MGLGRREGYASKRFAGWGDMILLSLEKQLLPGGLKVLQMQFAPSLFDCWSISGARTHSLTRSLSALLWLRFQPGAYRARTRENTELMLATFGLLSGKVFIVCLLHTL